MVVLRWLTPSVGGTLVAGVLVGTWELADVWVAPRWPLARPLAAVFGSPAALVLIRVAHVVPLPWTVWAAALWVATAEVTPGWGTVATLAAAGALAGTERGLWAPSALLVGVGAAALLFRAGARRLPQPIGRALPWAGLAAFVGAAGASTPMVLPVAALSSLYVLGRHRRAAYWAAVERQAVVDPLTGALTRYGWMRWVTALPPDRQTGAVIACDVDDFKGLNDTWGHAVGDAVLVAVVHRLRAALPADAAIVRPGGDEFTLWVPGMAAPAAAALARHVQAAVSTAPVTANGVALPVACSWGWAVGPLTAATADAADGALLAAKQAGKGTVVAADPAVVPRRDPARLALPLTTLTDALWAADPAPWGLLDLAGHLVTANAAYATWMGQPLPALVGQPTGLVDRATAPTLETGQRWHGVRYLRRADGHRAWAEVWLGPIRVGPQVVAYWARIRPLDEPPAVDPAVGWETVGVWAEFQPLVAVADGRVWGYEALARPVLAGRPWSITSWLAYAAATDTVTTVDRRCLTAAAAALRGGPPWPPDHRLALNVRLPTLADAAWMTAFLDALPLPRTHIILELSERDPALMGYDSWAALRAQYPGVHWALDDIGAGCHDVQRVMELGPEWLKIDRSWIVAAEQAAPARALLTQFAAWATAHGITLVAEGVETPAQRDLVATCGIPAAQGFFWGRPRTRVPRSHRAAAPTR